MTDNKIKFTKRKLEALTPPNTGSTTYHDTETQGLKARLAKTGTMTFFVYRKIKGRPERITIGKFPQVTVEQAKKQAQQINAAIAEGKNPNELKRLERQVMTLGELFDYYLENHAKLHKKSWKTDTVNFRNYMKKWSNRRITDIDKMQVIKWHSHIGNSIGIYTANRALALLKVMYNKAIEWQLFSNENPCNGIKKFKEKSRDRFIQPHEMSAFLEAVNEEPNHTIRDYIFLSLLTGARKNNVISMRWVEIDFHNKLWLIEDTKNNEPIKIPLMKEAIEVLVYRKEKTLSDWVFPGTGCTGHLVEPKKGWKRILERAGLKDLRIHDIRRTLGSWQAQTGSSLLVIGKTLGHKNPSTTQIYARLNTDPVRESMEKAVGAMFNSAASPDSKNELEQSDPIK